MTGSGRQAGYTLVEVMVVVAIVGVMAAIGIPSIKGVLPRIRLNSNTMLFSNEISLTRMRAISKSNDFCVVFYTATSANVAMRNSYVLKKAAAGACGISTGTQITVNKLTGTDLTRAGTFIPNLVNPFYDPPDPLTDFGEPSTLTASASGQMAVPLDKRALVELRTQDGGINRKRIIIEPTGRTYVQRWGGAGWTED